MRAKFGLSLFLCAVTSLTAEPALAQSLGDTGGMVESSLAPILAAFPVSEPIALTAICIVAGTLLLRLTRWFGLLMTVATFGFLGVVLLLAYEPGAIARIIEVVTRT